MATPCCRFVIVATQRDAGHASRRHATSQDVAIAAYAVAAVTAPLHAYTPLPRSATVRFTPFSPRAE